MLYKLSLTPAQDARRPAKPTREALRSVMRRLGGERAMMEWARENPTEFYRLYGRTVERELSITHDVAEGLAERMRVGSARVDARIAAPIVVDAECVELESLPDHGVIQAIEHVNPELSGLSPE